MRASIITLLLLFIGYFMTAQTINDVPFSEIDAEFIQIVGTKKLLSAKVKIDIDFGQLNRLLNLNDTKMKDADGNQVEFNSIIDALNFMSANGYEYLDSNAITRGNTDIYLCLMKKKTE